MRTLRVHAIVYCAAALVAAAVHAQPYPSKPIRIIVPFAAGGPADITSRIIAPRLTEVLGQPIVVDNHGGANGPLSSKARPGNIRSDSPLLVIPARGRDPGENPLWSMDHFALSCGPE
jgi:hypothetical protein